MPDAAILAGGQARRPGSRDTSGNLSADHDIVVPRTERGYHPLCAGCTRRCHPVVTRRFAERRPALLGLLVEVPVRVVEGNEIERFGSAARPLASVNTPDELPDLEALLRHEL
jgi:molybdopterin-guanine dinucleotide biosynthesis protein A